MRARELKVELVGVVSHPSNPRLKGEETILAIEDLWFRYSRESAVLRGITFRASPGKVIGLLGGNGAGKSTMLDIISGNLRPHSGKVLFAGAVVDKAPHVNAFNGLARTFQLARLFSSLTVAQNLLISLAGTGRALGRDDADAEADRVLGALGIMQVRNRLAGELSFGEQKLVAFGGALVRKPLLFLLDEPVAGVNAAIQEIIAFQVRSAAAAGATVLIVEHDFPFISALADEILLLRQGRVLHYASVGEFDSRALFGAE